LPANETDSHEGETHRKLRDIGVPLRQGHLAADRATGPAAVNAWHLLGRPETADGAPAGRVPTPASDTAWLARVVV